MLKTVYLCPSTPVNKCQWEGSQEEILWHFETHHKDFFLTVNHFNMELNVDFSANYLMHLNGETYLVQFNYTKEEEVAEIRLRYLGTLKKAKNLSYYIEIDTGNFAFTSKNSSDGYSLITRREGAILIDVSGIRTICGRKIIQHIVCFVNIEGEENSYVYRSIRRSFRDGKALDNKVKEIFQRNSSFRSSIRRKSVDNFDFSEGFRTSPLNSTFVDEILQDIVDEAMDESESKHNTPDLFYGDPFFDEDDFEFPSNFYREFQTSFFSESTKKELECIKENEHEHIIKIHREDESHFKKYEEVIVTENNETIAEIDDEDENKVLEMDEVVLRPKPSKLTPNRLSRAETEYYEKIQLMRCENCSMIMIPPIFVCLNGHSVCVSCKSLSCSCKSEVTDMRNIDLEEISRSLTHPCRFLVKGCTELYSCYEIRFHEIKCDYFQYKCPQCSTVGKFNEVLGHIRLLHPSLKIVETMENPFPKSSDFVVANKYGMFHCTAFIYDNSIEWSVAFTGREKISFSSTIYIKTKKHERTYNLKRNGNTCKIIIHLTELKNNRVKDKNAVLYIKTNS